MRKFEKPYDEYELQTVKPIEIELERNYLKKYALLASNPIYYFHSFQYLAGGLYRAALGYEILYDKKYENRLMRCLDMYLNQAAAKRVYYLEDIEISKPALLQGVIWFRGLKPKLKFSIRKQTLSVAAQKAVARVNKLDHSCAYVDIDLPKTDQIISISYTEYLKFKSLGVIRSLTNDHVQRGNFKTATQRRKVPKAFKSFRPDAA